MADLSAQPDGHKAAAASNGEAGQPATPSQAAVRRDGTVTLVSVGALEGSVG